MSEFTSGKWEVVQGAGNDEFDVISEVAPLHNFICVLFGYPTSRWEEQRANARLIAAAPEMYELLQNLAEYWDILIPSSKSNQFVVHAYKDIVKLLARLDNTEV